MTRSRMRHRIRAAVGDQRGFTITELAITLAMLLVVTGTFVGVLESLNRAVIRQQDRSINNDQARLAVEQLDREIRSGNVLYDPATEDDANFSMRIYTQSNATTRTPSFQCVQWVIEDQELLRRSWPPGEPENVSDWRIIAENVVNVEEGVDAFALDPDPDKGGRTVDIVLMVNSTPEDPTNRTVRIETSITGRNTSFGFPEDVCDPVPE
jgi:prepilin-type N-terminal cleavage/methylation domain-containing protein